MATLQNWAGHALVEGRWRGDGMMVAVINIQHSKRAGVRESSPPMARRRQNWMKNAAARAGAVPALKPKKYGGFAVWPNHRRQISRPQNAPGFPAQGKLDQI